MCAFFAVQVVTELLYLNLTCPAAVQRGAQFECKAEIKQGSGVTLLIDFGDGTTAGDTTPIYFAGL